MKIIKVLPIGFCYGVQHSYIQALKIINDHPQKHIYFLGWLVHNQNVINELTAYHHVSILDDKHTTRLSLVEQLPQTKSDLLVLSAHGTPKNAIEIAKNKGYEIHDLTCKYVYKTHDLIKMKLQADYQIIFIGKSRHPETLAIKAISPNITIIENQKDVNNLTLSERDKLFCTNQTTFNHIELLNLVDDLKNKYPYLEFNNDICQATKTRQLAVLNLDKQIDVCLVIGDKFSNNAHELLKIIKDNYAFDVHLVNSIQEINKQWFTNKLCCGLVSAASTPMGLVEIISNYLSNI